MISREAAALRIGRCWCGLTNEYRTTGLADRQASFLIAIFIATKILRRRGRSHGGERETPIY